MDVASVVMVAGAVSGASSVITVAAVITLKRDFKWLGQMVTDHENRLRRMELGPQSQKFSKVSEV